jgi:hypothetical protein
VVSLTCTKLDRIHRSNWRATPEWPKPVAARKPNIENSVLLVIYIRESVSVIHERSDRGCRPSQAPHLRVLVSALGPQSKESAVVGEHLPLTVFNDDQIFVSQVISAIEARVSVVAPHVNTRLAAVEDLNL